MNAPVRATAALRSMGRPPGVVHLVCMGVSGSGKSVIAERLAARLGWARAEGDDFHSDANRAKMSAGIPLGDDDRAPWLAALRDWMNTAAREGHSTVVTCSALKRTYRERLSAATGTVIYVHLDPPPEITAERLAARQGHFMPVSLLASQLEALEPLGEDEVGVVCGNTGDLDAELEAVMGCLEGRG